MSMERLRKRKAILEESVLEQRLLNATSKEEMLRFEEELKALQTENARLHAERIQLETIYDIVKTEEGYELPVVGTRGNPRFRKLNKQTLFGLYLHRENQYLVPLILVEFQIRPLLLGNDLRVRLSQHHLGFVGYMEQSSDIVERLQLRNAEEDKIDKKYLGRFLQVINTEDDTVINL